MHQEIPALPVQLADLDEKTHSAPTRAPRGRFGVDPRFYAEPLPTGDAEQAPVAEFPLDDASRAAYLRLCERIDKLMQQLQVEAAEASRAYKLCVAGPDGRVPRDLLRASRAAEDACRQLRGAYRQLASEATGIVAATRGWRRARASFSAQQLRAGRRHRTISGMGQQWPASCFDHAEFFRGPDVLAGLQPREPAAVVAHLYRNDPEAVAAHADQFGLRVEFLPDSCYFPGRTLSAVYTAKAARLPCTATFVAP